MHHLDNHITETCQVFPQFSYEGNRHSEKSGQTVQRLAPGLELSFPCLAHAHAHALHPLNLSLGLFSSCPPSPSPALPGLLLSGNTAPKPSPRKSAKALLRGSWLVAPWYLTVSPFAGATTVFCDLQVTGPLPQHVPVNNDGV